MITILGDIVQSALTLLILLQVMENQREGLVAILAG
jgi:hypothetical protein